MYTKACPNKKRPSHTQNKRQERGTREQQIGVQQDSREQRGRERLYRKQAYREQKCSTLQYHLGNKNAQSNLFEIT
jgi:hypothetical protein